MILREYQTRIASMASGTLHRLGICYLAMECRTGKTITAMQAASNYGARRVLFVTKKKAIPSIMADYDALRPSFWMEAVNYESIHKATPPFDFVIIDEAHSLGQYPRPSKRFDAVRTLAYNCPVLLLSGTPSPEGYAQLYHQFAISCRSPWRAHGTFYKWARAGYVNVKQRTINGHVLNDYSDANAEQIGRDIAPYLITYTQKEAGFETHIVEHDLVVEMDGATARAIKRLKHDRVIVLEDGRAIVADTPANLLGKLHQLSGGTAIADDDSRLYLDASKAVAIRDHFQGQKIGIFYVYQAEGDLLRKIFPNNTDNPEVFQASNDLVFIAQVKAAREGVRLDTADALVFYSLEYSFLSYEQAKQRAVSKERFGANDVYFVIADCGIDADILEAVRAKQDFTLSYYGRKERQRAII